MYVEFFAGLLGAGRSNANTPANRVGEKRNALPFVPRLQYCLSVHTWNENGVPFQKELPQPCQPGCWEYPPHEIHVLALLSPYYIEYNNRHDLRIRNNNNIIRAAYCRRNKR